MKAFGIRIFVFLTGYFMYSLIEIFSRGFTHWTMAVTGGLILTILYDMNLNLKAEPLWIRCMLGSIIITSVEFTVGVLVNIIADWNVWSYSDMPLNILGQICLPFTVLWFMLCIPAVYVCKKINAKFS